MSFENRWYDLNPKISHAVGCMESADDELKSKLAKLIIKIAMGRGVIPDRPKIQVFRRWYDHDKDIALAMEYLKAADERLRIEISEKIMAYIYNSGK